MNLIIRVGDSVFECRCVEKYRYRIVRINGKTKDTTFICEIFAPNERTAYKKISQACWKERFEQNLQKARQALQEAGNALEGFNVRVEQAETYLLDEHEGTRVNLIEPPIFENTAWLNHNYSFDGYVPVTRRIRGPTQRRDMPVPRLELGTREWENNPFWARRRVDNE